MFERRVLIILGCLEVGEVSISGEVLRGEGDLDLGVSCKIEIVGML